MQQSILHQLKVVEIIEETENAKTFLLQPLEEWQPVYKAGQYLTLVFFSNGTEKRRSYSLTSNPNEKLLSITVKRVVNGEFSRYLLDHTKIGSTLETIGIGGFFHFPEKLPAQTQQLFFLAAGSGITPVFALINEALQKFSDAEIILLYSNRNDKDVIFYKQLMQLQAQYSTRFRIEWLFSNSMNTYTGRLSNYLLNILLSKYVKEPQRTLFYLCGPFDYMLMINITLLAYGAKAEYIFREQFSTLPRIAKPVPPDTNQHTATLHIANNVYSISVQYPDTILAAAKKKNIMLPYSCEAGRCGSCVATCTLGKVWMAYNEVLLDDEIAKGKILVCQSYPVGGDIEIQYE